LYFANLYFVLFVGFYNTFDQAGGGGSERNFRNHQGFLIQFFNSGPDADFPAAQTIIVIRKIGHSTVLEIRENFWFFAAQCFNTAIDQLYEVVRQNFTGKTYSNTFGTLGQQKREFNRQMYRLLISSIIGKLPLSGFGIEGYFECKFRKTCFNITRSRSTISGECISPVSLGVDHQVLLSELNQCISNGRITVRV